jgi:leader peptidase (prepilin peptidase)/N-methyltransferase
MGGGDIKLFAVIGLAVGFKIMLLSFLFSVFLGAVFGIMGMLLRVVGRDQPVPFGPFIALGTLAAYFFGEEIAGIYLNML